MMLGLTTGHYKELLIMQSRLSIIRRVSLLLASLTILLVHSMAQGQERTYQAAFGVNKDPMPVNVLVGQSRVINFDKPVGRFSVSNPDIAEAVLVTPNQVLVNGKAFGQVNFIAWEQSGGDGPWRNVRLALGSVAATTVRARRAEAVLDGATPTPESADAAVQALTAELQPIDDVRSTADYRRLVAGRVLHRLIRDEGGW